VALKPLATGYDPVTALQGLCAILTLFTPHVYVVKLRFPVMPLPCGKVFDAL
jgi:hypothetical protein